jgi:hypothetical protein
MNKFITSAVLLGLMAFMYACSFSNQSTPAGYVGYITQDSVFGETKYVGLQPGPTSTGLGFRLHVANVSVTPYTYDENFTINSPKGDVAVVAHDKLKVQFSLHVVWKVKADRVKDYFEHYAVSDPDDDSNPDKVAEATYRHYLSPQIGTYAREEVEKYDGLKLKAHMADIQTSVMNRIEAFAKDSPFEITAINIGAIQPPKELTDEIAKVQQMKQQIPQKEEEIKVHMEMKKSRIEEALGIEESMRKLSSKLTPEYLAWEAIKAQAGMADSPNHTTTYIFNGLPLTGTVPVSGKAPAPANGQ